MCSLIEIWPALIGGFGKIPTSFYNKLNFWEYHYLNISLELIKNSFRSMSSLSSFKEDKINNISKINSQFAHLSYSILLLCCVLYISYALKENILGDFEIRFTYNFEGSLNIFLSSFVPVMVYSNADTDKLRILTENKGKSGIYQWTHLEFNKVYIGSAIDISTRLYSYYSLPYLNRLKKNSYIYSAIILYGYSSFSLSILEYIDIPKLNPESAKNLILEREQFFLDSIFSVDEPNTFNILKRAGNSFGFKHSEETLEKLSEMNKGKNHPSYGLFRTEETKALMSLSKIGENNPMFGKTGKDNPSFGKKRNEGTRAKMAAKRVKKIYIYSNDNPPILLEQFNSGLEAAKYISCSKSTISRFLDSDKLYKNKWIKSS